MKQTLYLLLLILLVLAGSSLGIDRSWRGSGQEWYDNHDPNNLLIFQCEVPPTIDGVIDSEWADADWHDLNEVPWRWDQGAEAPDYNDWPQDNINPANDTTEYFDVKAAFMWDSVTNLIFCAATGTDTVHYFTAEHVTWDAADSIEIFIDANNSNSDYRYDAERGQELRMGYNGSGGAWMVHAGQHPWTGRSSTQKTPEWAATLDGNTITYEVSVVPFEKLIMDDITFEPTTGTVIKTLTMGHVLGLDVRWFSRWSPTDRSSLSIAPNTLMWKNGIWMPDQKISHGSTTKPYGAIPGRGQKNVDVDKDLSWYAGKFAKKENVYFGTTLVDANRVVTPHSYQTYDPCAWQPYALGETYYWRVDDINDACTITGTQWYFTVTGAAYDPSPYGGVTVVVDRTKTVELSWQAGTGAEQHKIYFSDDETKVINSDPTVLIGTQGVNDVNIDATGLVLDQTYYWKVNEVSGGGSHTVDGVVWEFTVADFLVIEDFESYSNNGDVQVAWPGSDGGTAYRQATGGYSQDPAGTQAMLMIYDNTSSPYQSRVSHSIANEDWTVDGCVALSVMFHGIGTNSADDIFVELESGGGTLSGHQQYGNTSATQIEEWTEWLILISTFGVDATDITKITVGAGQDPGVLTGTGGVYFDFLRIAKCADWLTSDLSGDCFVDYNDLKILADQWLQAPGLPSADIAPEGGDSLVDFLDFAVVAGQWLVNSW